MPAKRPKAIDLYSGIGGWSLGLQFAGIEVVSAFEWWEAATHTYQANIGHPAQVEDIRQLTFDKLPEPGTVDFVVGSPPCTEFSFANRGGNGDLKDGLRDVVKFLEIVAHLKPKYWAMENVPRLAGIVSTEIGLRGKLARFRSLIRNIELYTMDEYGVPQRRTRCLVGDFPTDTLKSYKGHYSAMSLGNLIKSLALPNPVDPVYGFSVPQGLVDHAFESVLTAEEIQLNEAAKCHHPVYNRMSFPEQPDRVCRTITATCTRVSRESIIVESGSGYRRLTLRERASAQSFPTTYQFLAKSYSQRMKMIGNAIPPLFAYQVCMSMLGKSVADLSPVSDLSKGWALKSVPNQDAHPDRRATVLRKTRTFRFAIPGLRFGSGLRFELANQATQGGYRWGIAFVFGTSHNIIRPVVPRDFLENVVKAHSLSRTFKRAVTLVRDRLSSLSGVNGDDLQEVWAGRSHGYQPLQLLELLGEVATSVEQLLSEANQGRVAEAVRALYPELNKRAMAELPLKVLTGTIITSEFNIGCPLSAHYQPQEAASDPQLVLLRA